MSKVETLEIPSVEPGLPGYRIVFEKQDSSPEKKQLSPADDALFENLYMQIQEAPNQHIDALIQFHFKHPEVPEVANLLAYAYLRLKKKKESEELIEKTYQLHPDYLLAKINFADQCLRRKKIEQIPILFQGIFELNQLYPKQTSFYYSEYRGFYVVMGFYHLAIEQRDRAEEYYLRAFQVDPLHSSVSALEKALSKTSLLKKCLFALQKLAGISKNP